MITSDIVRALGKNFRFATRLLHIDERGERTYFILASEKSLIRVDDAAQCIPLTYLPSTQISPDVLDALSQQGFTLRSCPKGAAIRTGQTVYKSFKMEKISFKDEKNVENSV